MRSRFLALLIILASFLVKTEAGLFPVASAQFNNGRDSIVRLIDAKAAILEEMVDGAYRIVRGPAKFLHNNTYLLCDSAVWDVSNNVINAIGHVQIIQQETYLVSDKLTYYSLDNLAEFRGDVVRLYNKKGDQLKTRYLDYHTNDSTAIFYNGGAMRSKDGQIIEGSNGRYEAESRRFSFDGDVQMFADSIFVVANEGVYDSNRNVAFFYNRITAWKERDTLFSNSAMYESSAGCLHLTEDNYIATPNQQIWADHIKYFRESGNAELYNNIQLQDDEQKMFLLGDEGKYQKEPFVASLTRNPVVGLFSEEEVRHQIKDSLGVVIRDSITIKRDTLFARGDTLRMRQIPMYQVDSAEKSNAAKRLALLDLDPMKEIHEENQKYLEAYHKNKELIGKPKPPVAIKQDESIEPISNENIQDTLSFKPPLDSLALGMPADSLGNLAADSLGSVAAVDSTMVTLLSMFNNVRMYRSDVSGSCDSLVYTSLDSIARFYKNPVLWNEKTKQFTADSIQVALRENKLFKANLIENAMIITQEDSIHFNQIKSVEMVAYFSDNDISRFDALGGVQAMLFFRERDSSVTLMNQKECNLLSAKIQNKEIQRVQYVGNVKSDMIPTYNLEIDKQRLRGFTWRADEIPQEREVITDRKVRESMRGTLTEIRFPIYPQTKIYYPDDHKIIGNLKREIDGRIASEKRDKEGGGK